MAQTKTELTSQFASLLQVQTTDPERQARVIQGRLIRLGYAKYCTRCGGSGHYSFNLMYGTVCFKCGGSGYLANTLTAKMLKQIQAERTTDQITQMVNEQNESARLNKLAQSAESRVMAAWKASGVSEAYKWTNAWQGSSTYSARDEHIAQAFNKPMADLHKAICDQAGKVAHLRQQVAPTSPKLAEAINSLVAAADAAVAQINTLAAELATYLAS